MATRIKTWQIIDGKLQPLDSSLAHEGKKETQHLETWIASNPVILGPSLLLIGRQVTTRSGPLDLLAIDPSGNLVVIELKRDKLPREVLAQAIDYASDVAGWSIEKIGETCSRYTGKSLEDAIGEAFPDVDLETLNINETQRILLVGFEIETSLERMVEWLSDSYGVAVNAMVLNYIRTAGGDELITQTAIISEDVEQERIKQKKFTIPMSDEPGDYDDETLRDLLGRYLSQSMLSAQRIRDILLPACLSREMISRDELRDEFARHGAVEDPAKAGYALTSISYQLGMLKNDFLRQVIGYSYPTSSWEKDHYFIRPEYRELVTELLQTLRADRDSGLSEQRADAVTPELQVQ